jgi:integrase/recombinase XerD
LQSKAKGLVKETVITYPESIIFRLRDYIGAREGLVFVTKSGRPVLLNQIAIIFAKAGERAGIGFKVSPHTLRASTVTYLKRQGFRDSDIMKITGRASS